MRSQDKEARYLDEVDDALDDLDPWLGPVYAGWWACNRSRAVIATAMGGVLGSVPWETHQAYLDRAGVVNVGKREVWEYLWNELEAAYQKHQAKKIPPPPR